MWCTPFPAIFAAVGSWFLELSYEMHIYAFLHQVFWVFLTVIFMVKHDRTVLAKIQKGEC